MTSVLFGSRGGPFPTFVFGRGGGRGSGGGGRRGLDGWCGATRRITAAAGAAKQTQKKTKEGSAHKHDRQGISVVVQHNLPR